MLPEQNWRADAVVRLLISILICIYAASLAGSVIHYVRTGNSGIGFFLVAGTGFVCLAAALVLVRAPLSMANLRWRLGGSLACFYGGMLLGAWAQQMAAPPPGASVMLMIVSGIGFQGSTLVLMWLFLQEQRVCWSEGFGWSRKPMIAIGFGLIVGLAFLPVGWTLQMLVAMAMDHLPWLQLKPVEQQSIQTLRSVNTNLHRLVLAFTTIGLAPIAEEMLFRGVLYKWIKQIGFPRVALWGLSILFAVIHFNVLTFPALFLLSLILTVLYERTGNLLAPIMAHASFNAANFGMLYLMERGLG